MNGKQRSLQLEREEKRIQLELAEKQHAEEREEKRIQLELAEKHRVEEIELAEKQ